MSQETLLCGGWGQCAILSLFLDKLWLWLPLLCIVFHLTSLLFLDSSPPSLPPIDISFSAEQLIISVSHEVSEVFLTCNSTWLCLILFCPSAMGFCTFLFMLPLCCYCSQTKLIIQNNLCSSVPECFIDKHRAKQTLTGVEQLAEVSVTGVANWRVYHLCIIRCFKHSNSSSSKKTKSVIVCQM